MTEIEFELFRASQYCDKETCDYYQKTGLDNLGIHSRKTAQLYCKKCNNKFSVRRGTMFYCLRTPMVKIINSLSLLSSGLGVNATVRQSGVTADSLRVWVHLASTHVAAFTTYMQRDMHLEQVQIDEFWSYIRKKRKI